MMLQPLIFHNNKTCDSKFYISFFTLFCVVFLIFALCTIKDKHHRTESENDAEVPVGRNLLKLQSSFSCGANLDIGIPIFCGSGRIHSYSLDTYLCRPHERMSQSVCCLCEKTTRLPEGFALEPYFSVHKSSKALFLPQVIGGLAITACGSVTSGQPPCSLSCSNHPSHELQCTWSLSCAPLKQHSCPPDFIQMANRACDSDTPSEEQQCCSCVDSALRLRGGFFQDPTGPAPLPIRNSRKGASPVVQPRTPIARMQVDPFVPANDGLFWGPELWTTYSAANNPDWQMPKVHSGPFIREDELFRYKMEFDRLMNKAYMEGRIMCGPYEAGDSEDLASQYEEIQKAKKYRYAALKDWFYRNPTSVYPVGPHWKAQTLHMDHIDKEAMVVISNNKAKNIKNILDESWWGKQWNSMPDERRPLLFVFCFQDEANDYLTELIPYPENLFLVSHSAAGFGPLRNKALGILKQKMFKSGIIIEDDVDFIDSSRILHNEGPQEGQPAENIVEVMFDILSGEPERAQRWKGQDYGEFGMLDYIAPLQPINAPITDQSQLGRFGLEEGAGYRREELEKGSNYAKWTSVGSEWYKYHPLIGLSKDAIEVGYYDNTILFGDPQSMFTKRMQNTAKNSLRKLALLEMRVGRRKFDPLIRPRYQEKSVEASFWEWILDQVAQNECSRVDVLKKGVDGMVLGSEVLLDPEITYSALAVYQWVRLNIASEFDQNDQKLWYVFNGVYNERKTLAWANEFIERTGIASRHPYKSTIPPKLVMLYVEQNILQIDTIEPVDHAVSILKEYPEIEYFEKPNPQYEDIELIEVRKWEEPRFLKLLNPREPYFDDQYPLKPVPPEFFRYNSNFNGM